MGRVAEQKSDYKSNLVTEICSISIQHSKCAHRLSNNLIKSHFVDWYRLLRVEEHADIEVIRKQYLKLALQLHPDKNKHPKAEFAFKLVSEAYRCLSDSAKRKDFDLERWRRFCIECNRIPYTTCNPPSNSIAAKLKVLNPIDLSRSSKILRGLKDIRERFKEEARVIENCLRSNAGGLKKESPVFKPSNHLFTDYHQQRPRKESSVFNPSDYRFQGYPHLMTRVYNKPDNLWYLQTGKANYEQRRMKFESPIFEINPGRVPFRSRTASLYI